MIRAETVDHKFEAFWLYSSFRSRPPQTTTLPFPQTAHKTQQQPHLQQKHKPRHPTKQATTLSKKHKPRPTKLSLSVKTPQTTHPPTHNKNNNTLRKKTQTLHVQGPLKQPTPPTPNPSTSPAQLDAPSFLSRRWRRRCGSGRCPRRFWWRSARCRGTFVVLFFSFSRLGAVFFWVSFR